MAIRVEVVSTQGATELAHPRNMVTIKEGTPYVVPSNKLFVLTGVGRTSVPSAAVTLCSFLADGVAVLRAGVVGASIATVQAGTRLYAGVCSVSEIPLGLVYREGVSLTVDDNVAGSTGRAYGFICDE